MDKKDWVEWHKNYDSCESDLSTRLDIVRNLIGKCLPDSPFDSFKILDICAGDGRDLIPVLSKYPLVKNVQAKLIEINLELVEQARKAAETAGLDQVTIVLGDAALTSSYKDISPVDLIMFCGVFGNISNQDVETIIKSLPEFCKPSGHVIWTRNRREPDLTPAIREMFKKNGFAEVEFIAPDTTTYGIGLNQFSGNTVPYTGNRQLFRFTR